MGRSKEAVVPSWLEREGAMVPSDLSPTQKLPAGDMLILADAYEADLDILI